LRQLNPCGSEIGYVQAIDHFQRLPTVRFVDVTMFYTAESGGVRTYLTAKGNWLSQWTEIEHYVVAPDLIDGRLDEKFIGVPSVPIPYAQGYRMPWSCRLAARRIAELQPDLIEVGDPYQLAWAALRAKERLDVPAVAFCHSDLPRLIGRRFGSNAQRVAARYLRALYRHFDLVLAPSMAMAGRLDELGVRHVVHQPLGVDSETFSPSRRKSDLRQRLGLPQDTRLLVYAGRFSREKRLPLLLEAVRRLGEPYHLLMVGSGARLPPAERVTRLPFQRDIASLAELIASCDVLVHAGDQETFGLIVLEAMACGIPVVGPAAGGVGELVEPDTGVLVEPGCVAALAEGIEHIFRCDIATMGANARRKVLDGYQWSRVIPQLMHHYAGLFSTHQRPQFGLEASYAGK
jgi:alpha-1,6-mannosyltransferase